MYRVCVMCEHVMLPSLTYVLKPHLRNTLSDNGWTDCVLIASRLVDVKSPT